VLKQLDDDREAVVRFEATLIQNTLCIALKIMSELFPFCYSGTPKIVFHHWCFEMIKFPSNFVLKRLF